MTPEEYTDQRELLLKHLSRCKTEEDSKRIGAKIQALEFKHDFPRLHICRPEAKLQQYEAV